MSFVPFTALATALLVDPRPSLEARQRAAQVRASMLTGNWTWMLGLSQEDCKATLRGLGAWCSQSPQIGVTALRLRYLHQAVFQSGQANDEETDPFFPYILTLAYPHSMREPPSRLPWYWGSEAPTQMEPRKLHKLGLHFEALEIEEFLVLTVDRSSGAAVVYEPRTEGPVLDPNFLKTFGLRMWDRMATDFTPYNLDVMFENEEVPTEDREILRQRIQKTLAALSRGDFSEASQQVTFLDKDLHRTSCGGWGENLPYACGALAGIQEWLLSAR
jgi:hypothetical protein